MYVQQQFQRLSQGNLKLHQQHFPQQQAMLQQPFLQFFWGRLPACLVIFSRPLCLFVEKLLSLCPPPKTPVIASIIVEIISERAVSIENIVIPCSRNRVLILTPKDVFLSRTFSRVCLILATCVWRSFRFCDSISILACFSVFKPSNLSLYNYLYSSY